MKIFAHITVMILAMFFFNCKRTPDLGKPFDTEAQMIGTWNVSQVKQIDYQAYSLGFEQGAKLDITRGILGKEAYTEVVINFSKDHSFSIDNDNAYVNLPLAGKWNISLGFLNLVNANNDTVQCLLKKEIDFRVIDARCQLEYTRYQKNDNEEKPIVVYRYSLEKQVQEVE